MSFTLRSTLIFSVPLLFAASSLAQESTSEHGHSPTDAHNVLLKDVGTWDADVTVWPTQGADPVESKATETTWKLGRGLWIVSDFLGDMGGQEFHGHGQFGYDPQKKKYVGTWIDSFVPYMYKMEGTYDADTKTLTMMSTGPNPQTGKMTTTKNVSHYNDDGTRDFAIYQPVDGKPGEYWKMLEIHYTRKGE